VTEMFGVRRNFWVTEEIVTLQCLHGAGGGRGTHRPDSVSSYIQRSIVLRRK
jgi:hypothetical protein